LVLGELRPVHVVLRTPDAAGCSPSPSAAANLPCGTLEHPASAERSRLRCATSSRSPFSPRQSGSERQARSRPADRRNPLTPTLQRTSSVGMQRNNRNPTGSRRRERLGSSGAWRGRARDDDPLQNPQRDVDKIAADLRAAFPAMKGFSRANLMYMRAFAEAWPETDCVQQPVGQLPWGHNEDARVASTSAVGVAWCSPSPCRIEWVTSCMSVWSCCAGDVSPRMTTISRVRSSYQPAAAGWSPVPPCPRVMPAPPGSVVTKRPNWRSAQHIGGPVIGQAPRTAAKGRHSTRVPAFVGATQVFEPPPALG
jgi:hypothetical protein